MSCASSCSSTSSSVSVAIGLPIDHHQCRESIILHPRFYVSTSKSIIKALINMHSFEIQLSPIG
ncbi:TPA: hypothetical protein HGS88_13940 [Escherichia coli]|nr:hypothetical protein [Escherichia coli]